MKNIKLFAVAFAVLTAGGLTAQNLYDANSLMGSDLNGTARFVGMGGAMGALGGDISTMSTNPAGIGIYRSNDAMISFGFNNTSTESSFSGIQMNSNKYRGSFDNVGIVYSSKIGEQTALKYVNLGFNYHKLKNFNRVMNMGGDLNNLSQTDQMARQSMGHQPEYIGNGWDDPTVGWLSILGWNGYLTQYDNGKYSGFPGEYPWGDFTSIENGGINAYDFNASFNIQNRFYFGFTLGVYNVDYSRETYYREGFDPDKYGRDGSFYTLDNFFKTTGNGVDFKVGVIIRPVLESPLRIGLAIHTPTWYNLRNVTAGILNSDVDRNQDGVITGSNNPDINEQFTVDTGDAITDYKLATPWKYNLSLGYTLGNSVALGAEYEYSDYSTAKLRYDDGRLLMDETNDIKKDLKGVHTVRAGVEYKPVSQFAVRAGYNFSTASISESARKEIPNSGLNSIRTDTEFSNTKAIHNITLGMGYKGSWFYADLAYQYNMYKSDFYPFNMENLAATTVSNDRQQLLLTLGFRF